MYAYMSKEEIKNKGDKRQFKKRLLYHLLLVVETLVKLADKLVNEAIVCRDREGEVLGELGDQLWVGIRCRRHCLIWKE